MFRAVADQLERNEHQHMKYRKIAVQHIDKNRAHFAMFLDYSEDIDSYLERMGKDGEWGGYFELVALSDLLNVDFKLHIFGEEPYVVGSEVKGMERRMYHLAYYKDRHYDSVRKIGEL